MLKEEQEKIEKEKLESITITPDNSGKPTLTLV